MIISEVWPKDLRVAGEGVIDLVYLFNLEVDFLHPMLEAIPRRGTLHNLIFGPFLGQILVGDNNPHLVINQATLGKRVFFTNNLKA